jgi:hypothetical protein
MNNQHELHWWKSSKSSSSSCVEVATDGDQVRVRDSKDPSGAVLTFDRAAFKDFITQVCDGSPSLSAGDRLQ